MCKVKLQAARDALAAKIIILNGYVQLAIAKATEVVTVENADDDASDLVDQVLIAISSVNANASSYWSGHLDVLTKDIIETIQVAVLATMEV